MYNMYYIYTHMYVCIYTNVCVYIYNMYINIYTYIHMYVCPTTKNLELGQPIGKTVVDDLLPFFYSHTVVE